jgi:hypothetical protein
MNKINTKIPRSELAAFLRFLRAAPAYSTSRIIGEDPSTDRLIAMVIDELEARPTLLGVSVELLDADINWALTTVEVMGLDDVTNAPVAAAYALYCINGDQASR